MVGADRYDRSGKLKCLAESAGYLMVRRPGCTPFVLSKDDWQRLAIRPGPDSERVAASIHGVRETDPVQ